MAHARVRVHVPSSCWLHIDVGDREPDDWNHRSTEGPRTTNHLEASQTQQSTQQSSPKLIPLFKYFRTNSIRQRSD